MDANLRRYSMPSAGIYDRVTGLLFRRRYDEIASEIAAAAAANASRASQRWPRVAAGRPPTSPVPFGPPVGCCGPSSCAAMSSPLCATDSPLPHSRRLHAP
jgi:hypothetical protein